MKEIIKKRKFFVYVPDPTAVGGVAKIAFLPWFDRVPSTKDLVNTDEAARQYCLEVFNCEPL